MLSPNRHRKQHSFLLRAGAFALLMATAILLGHAQSAAAYQQAGQSSESDGAECHAHNP